MGMPFDPNRHQAISMVENGNRRRTVIAVMQKGYELNGRSFVRMVMVAPGPGCHRYQA